MSDSEIRKLRTQGVVAQRLVLVDRAKTLKEKGYTCQEIGSLLGLKESSVRLLLRT